MLLPLCVWGGAFGTYFVMHFTVILYFLVLLTRRETAGWFTLIVILMSCDC